MVKKLRIADLVSEARDPMGSSAARLRAGQAAAVEISGIEFALLTGLAKNWRQPE